MVLVAVSTVVLVFVVVFVVVVAVEKVLSVDTELVISAFHRAQVCFTHIHNTHQLLLSERTGGRARCL